MQHVAQVRRTMPGAQLKQILQAAAKSYKR
jgi:hypothetical protein